MNRVVQVHRNGLHSNIVEQDDRFFILKQAHPLLGSVRPLIQQCLVRVEVRFGLYANSRLRDGMCVSLPHSCEILNLNAAEWPHQSIVERIRHDLVRMGMRLNNEFPVQVPDQSTCQIDCHVVALALRIALKTAFFS